MPKAGKISLFRAVGSAAEPPMDEEKAGENWGDRASGGTDFLLLFPSARQQLERRI
jgi:hypothetical protein